MQRTLCFCLSLLCVFTVPMNNRLMSQFLAKKSSFKVRFRQLRIKGFCNVVDSISTLPRSVHKSKCSGGKKHEVTFIKHKANVHNNINTSMLVTEKIINVQPENAFTYTCVFPETDMHSATLIK